MPGERKPIDSRWYVLLVNKARFRDVCLLRRNPTDTTKTTLRLESAISFGTKGQCEKFIVDRGGGGIRIPPKYLAFAEKIDRHRPRTRRKKRKMRTEYGVLKLEEDQMCLFQEVQGA